LYPKRAVTADNSFFDMAIAIKAIPTLYGEDAIRFREEMEANEQAFLTFGKKDREKDPFIIKMREMLNRSGL